MRKYVVAARTMIGGSETILAQSSFPLLFQIFNIEFPYLLLPTVNKNYIIRMLANMQIPPSTIERVSQQITSYAFFVASICKERRSGWLNIVVELDVRNVEYYRTEAMIDIEVLRGFSFVPPLRASEIKKFGDDHTGEEEEESLTCAICMDEFVSGVDIRVLPWRHFFHNECILKWVENKNSCPYCRFTMQ
ncbi:hypothetical protein NE237_031632 [Protea cynaroides]|uniref:RING-type domain-containing protein n=1 Tax=Protea cynaroides TaxID=273540 RepID=A0A9Q0L1X9_9MAGN|nr:hypothetical protein NE237_031632 [Protea cynaroides]